MTQSEKKQKPTLLRRTGYLLGTVATITLAVGLVSAGSGVIAERAAATEEGSQAAPITVQTVSITLSDSYQIETLYRGRVEAGRKVDLGFESGGTVAEILVDEGDKVEADQTLARLDTASLEAQLAAETAARDALEAQAELARRTAERQKELNARDFASAQRLDEAELTLAQLTAEVRRANAAILATEVALEKSEVRAPFDAEIGSRLIDEGARVQPGQSLVTVFEARAPQFRVGLPADVANTLSAGKEVSITFGTNTAKAVVSRVRGDINTATRTRDLVLDLPSDVPATEGALGTMLLQRTVAGKGAWVPATALSEGVRGLWTLFVVENGVTQREAVELVHMDKDRAYVRGHLATGMEVVATGPHRIAAGQAVVQAGS